MILKYYLNKLFGRWFDTPVFREGSIVGYSLVRSEKYRVQTGNHTMIYTPFFLHNVVLGDYSYIARNSNASNLNVGKFCSIGPNFCCGMGLHPTKGISTSPMFYSTAKQNGVSLCRKNKFEEQKQTTIGNDVFIGANVTVLDGVHISDGAVIGAGAVVVHDIPPYAVAVGVPAKVVRYRFEESIIEDLLERKWWNDSEPQLMNVERLFWDVNDFLLQK